MRRSVRDRFAEAAINEGIQAHLDENLSFDELESEPLEMHHPIVGNKPKDCSPSELDKVRIWHIERAEEMKRDILQRAGMTAQQ